MPDISQIMLPSGSVYNLKDAQARADIAALSGYTTYLGVTTTELTDGSTTNPITIDGKSITAKTGGIANYGAKEFIFNGTVWQEFGDLSGLGTLAHKDFATGSYQPEGTVSAPTVTVTPATGTGEAPAFSATVENEVLTLGFNPGSVPANIVTGITSATASAPTFTGTSKNVTVS